jgi:hypothetical protein
MHLTGGARRSDARCLMMVPVRTETWRLNHMAFLNRPPHFDFDIGIIGAAFPDGVAFTTYMAEEALQKAGVEKTYRASFAIRYLRQMQDECPEASQLRKIGHRFVFETVNEEA